MKIPEWLPAYGSMSYRNKKCPTEEAEQITFFNEVRMLWPDTIGRIAIHVRNEGKFTVQQRQRQKLSGMVCGASDISIPGCPSFICELKRQDHTMSVWQAGQVEYLEAAKANGAFVCVAFGYVAALEAVSVWIAMSTTESGFKSS